MKTRITKVAFRKILNKLDYDETLTFSFKNIIFDIKRKSKSLYSISKGLCFKSINISDLIKQINFRNHVYLLADNDKIQNLSDRINRDLSHTSKYIKNKIYKSKCSEEYHNIRSLLLTFDSNILREQNKYEIDLLHDLSASKAYYKSRDLRDKKVWDIIKKVLSNYDFIHVNEYDEFYIDFTIYGFNYKLYTYTEMSNEHVYIDNDDIRGIIFEQDTAFFLQNSIEYFGNLKYDKYSNEQYIYTTKCNKYNYNFFNKIIINIMNRYMYSKNISYDDLYDYDDIDKSTEIYVTDDEFKSKVTIYSIDDKLITGSYYDRVINEHINHIWLINGKSDDDNVPNIIKYKHRLYKYQNFNWDILPKNINMLFKNLDTGTWSGSSQYHMTFSHKSNRWSNDVMQEFIVDIDKYYNFSIINTPDILFIEKDTFDYIDVEEKVIDYSFRNNKNIKCCVCGNTDCTSLYWNNVYQGHYCDKHKLEFGYKNTMSFM